MASVPGSSAHARLCAPLARNRAGTFQTGGRTHLKVKGEFAIRIGCQAPRSLTRSRWLYRLFIGIDANFRLKRKKVSSDLLDPSLNEGSSYMVRETTYKDHLATFDTLHADPSDHCNNHDAVKLATLKSAAGLAASGLATVDCARHDMKRPCSSGDLQKGER